MRTVALAALGFGVTIGFVEVAVPAAATEGRFARRRWPAAAALFSVSSVIFGVLLRVPAVAAWPRLRLPVAARRVRACWSPLLAIPSLAAGAWPAHCCWRAR